MKHTRKNNNLHITLFLFYIFQQKNAYDTVICIQMQSPLSSVLCKIYLNAEPIKLIVFIKCKHKNKQTEEERKRQLNSLHLNR